MDVTISVDEEMFKEIVEKELAALPKEKIQEILVKAIEAYFSKNNYEMIDKLLIEKNSYKWDNPDCPTEFTKQLIQNTDCSKLQDIVDKCIEKLSNNYEKILITMLTDIFTQGLMDNYNFHSQLKRAINDELWKKS